MFFEMRQSFNILLFNMFFKRMKLKNMKKCGKILSGCGPDAKKTRK